MNTWIVPCNLTVFNIIEHFDGHKTMLWKGTSATETGDVVYLYIGRPFSEIKYKCVVVESNLPMSLIESSEYDVLKVPSKRRKNFIRIEMEQEYPRGLLPLSKLMKHGLVSVQSQMRLAPGAVQYIEKVTQEGK